MLFRIQLGFLLFFAVAGASAASPMSGASGRQNGDFEPASPKERFAFLQRKSPGLFSASWTDSPSDELALADRARADDRLRNAAKIYRSVVEHWGTSPEAPVAQKAYADILVEMEKMEDAFLEYQYLVKFYAGQFDYDGVLDAQMQIANYLMTMRRGKFLFFPGFLAPERAIPFFEQILANGPKWKRAPEAQFKVGLINEEAGSLEEAILAYDAVVNRFRNHTLASEAAFRKAVCLTKLWKKTPRDERSLREALSALASYMAAFPASEGTDEAKAHLDELSARLAEMYFARAEFYEKINRNDKAAVIAYTEFIRQFPSSKKAITAQERIDALKNKQKVE